MINQLRAKYEEMFVDGFREWMKKENPKSITFDEYSLSFKCDEGKYGSYYINFRIDAPPDNADEEDKERFRIFRQQQGEMLIARELLEYPAFADVASKFITAYTEAKKCVWKYIAKQDFKDALIVHMFSDT